MWDDVSPPPELELLQDQVLPETRPALAALRWLVAFAKTDLDELPPWVDGDLTEEALGFLVPTVSSIMRTRVVSMHLLQPLDWDRIAKLQDIARTGIADYLAGRRAFEWRGISISGYVQRRGDGAQAADAPVLTSWPEEVDVQQLFAWRAAQVIESVGTRLRQCANPECQHPFVATRRQQFCTRLCNDRVRVAKYRARLADDPDRRARRLARRRAAYARKVRTKLGANVKVRQKEG